MRLLDDNTAFDMRHTSFDMRYNIAMPSDNTLVLPDPAEDISACGADPPPRPMKRVRRVTKELHGDTHTNHPMDILDAFHIPLQLLQRPTRYRDFLDLVWFATFSRLASMLTQQEPMY
jgi:hypothetical protein